jgi:hypothetical protein
MSVLPGPVRQIGYVVTDLDRAINGWLELGDRLRGSYGGHPSSHPMRRFFESSLLWA